MTKLQRVWRAWRRFYYRWAPWWVAWESVRRERDAVYRKAHEFYAQRCPDPECHTDYLEVYKAFIRRGQWARLWKQFAKRLWLDNLHATALVKRHATERDAAQEKLRGVLEQAPMTPPSSSKVEALIARLHHPCAKCRPGPGQLCDRGIGIRSAVLAALELAAERLWYAQERTAWEIVCSLSIPSEKPREEP